MQSVSLDLPSGSNFRPLATPESTYRERVEIYVGRAVVAMLANNYKRVGIKTGQTNRQTDKQTLLYVLHYIRGQGQKA